MPARVPRAGNKTYPILSMTMHSGLVDQSSKFGKRVASIDTSAYKVVEKGQLVVGFPIDEGVLSFQERYQEAIVSPAYDVWTLKSSVPVNRRYLERFLRSERALHFYASKLRGTTARRRTLPDDLFLSLCVPLPPLAEQQKIAAILDQAEALQAKRRQALAKLDTLTQSLFLEMFGDTYDNDKNWPQVEVASYVAGFETGKSILPADDDSSAKYRILKVSSVSGLEFAGFESKPLPPSFVPSCKDQVRKGDLIFSRANTSELVGATAYVWNEPDNLILPDKLWRFVWRSDGIVDPLFVWFMFRQPSLRRELTRRATGTSGSMKNISQEKVLSMRTALPSLGLQQSFARFVKRVAQLKMVLVVAADKGHYCQIALQHKAFRGEL